MTTTTFKNIACTPVLNIFGDISNKIQCFLYRSVIKTYKEKNRFIKFPYKIKIFNSVCVSLPSHRRMQMIFGACHVLQSFHYFLNLQVIKICSIRVMSHLSQPCSYWVYRTKPAVFAYRIVVFSMFLNQLLRIHDLYTPCISEEKKN